MLHDSKLISIDFQKDFCAKNGRWYQPRLAHAFIREELVPTLRQTGRKIAEIISDYRLPRPSEKEAYCIPGEEGYVSEISEDVKSKNVWIKCMNSPVWVRDNIGIADCEPGQPYSDPNAFTAWLEAELGSPKEIGDVILVGLTLDCCVLCTAQELYYRGYSVRYLMEGVDTFWGTQEEKDAVFKTPLTMWGQPISWDTIKDAL